jgi:hypothetical protein
MKTYYQLNQFEYYWYIRFSVYVLSLPLNGLNGR